MDKDELKKVEQPAIDQLVSLGWTYLPGAALSPEQPAQERSSFKEVVLPTRLNAAIQKINPWISVDNLRKVTRGLIHPAATTLMEANQDMHTALVRYLSVEQDLGKGRKGQTVRIIDFDDSANNEFLVTNQFRVAGPDDTIIPDLVLFVNGLPLAIIECKSPYINHPIAKGIEQLRRYADLRNPSDNEGAERLFYSNQMMVSTCGRKAHLGTISSGPEHYLEWKDPYPLRKEDIKGDIKEGINQEPSSQEVLLAGVFSPDNFLDLIRNFIVFEPIDGKVIKKLARYQQYRAVHKTVLRLKTAPTRKEKGGIIWHTQGSGKSLTMVFLAIKIRRDPVLKAYKLVFLTDRTQLDEQLTTTFARTQGETIYHADSVKRLHELLRKDSSDLVTAMIQKFRETDTAAQDEPAELTELNSSEKIIVLADEAHRSQYGDMGVNLNVALPNAPKIAFTGTPLIKTQKTSAEFGSYIDTYTIEQAVRDKATVQILYEGREARTKVTGDSLDALFDAYFGDKTLEEQEAIRKKHGTELAVLEAPQRIREICIDLLRHYQEHIQPDGFKAMIVTASRHAAVTYKEMLDELGAPPSAVIISGTAEDKKRLRPHSNSALQKQQRKQFAKPLADEPLAFLIVKDMLLTGFDAPICQVMYLDRKLRDHTLLQAIARVNRTAQGKQRGFIVDYYGLSDYLADALEVFSAEDIQGAMQSLKDEIPKLMARHTRVMRYFTAVGTAVGLQDREACLEVLADQEVRHQYWIDFRKFARSMNIVMPDPAAKPYLADLKRLGKINIAARNIFQDDQLSLDGAGEKVRKLIAEHLSATGVDPKIAPIELFAADFREHIQGIKSAQVKAAAIEHAIKAHISVQLEEDPAYYKKLSERLDLIIQQQGEHWDSLVEQLSLFMDSIEPEREAGAEELGLTETEYAFRNILHGAVCGERKTEYLSAAVAEEINDLSREMVSVIDEQAGIVDYFRKKSNGCKEIRRETKRRLVDASFIGDDDEGLIKTVQDEFVDLARTRYGKK
jgi:type I restriction enzyme R subunit